MDTSSSGSVLDPSECSKLSLDEKRAIVYELSKHPQDAQSVLQAWSRRDLLEILCAEMEKERKYTGLTKQRLIEHLLKIVSDKKQQKATQGADSAMSPSSHDTNNPSKRQRKRDHHSLHSVSTTSYPVKISSEVVNNSLYCQNSACKATMRVEDDFCKRCSCCICFKFDDNKDPSLWLVCSSDLPSKGDSCGLSCHLECALKHDRAGIVKSKRGPRLDGSFCCVSCGKLNDLLGCWKKQLLVAKDARRVDVLCYRILLCHKLLNGTDKYHSLHKIVDMAKKKLEAELGPLNGLPTVMARGIVNRLSSGAEVQKLCSVALESLDSMLSAPQLSSPEAESLKPALSPLMPIRVEGISATSVTVVVSFADDTQLSKTAISCFLWHRKTDAEDYPVEPTCKLFKPRKEILVSELHPATKYLFKVVAINNGREFGRWEHEFRTNDITESAPKSITLDSVSAEPNNRCMSSKANSSGVSNPSSEGDESNTAICGDLNKLPESNPDDCDDHEMPVTKRSHDCGTGGIHTHNASVTPVSNIIKEAMVQEETAGYPVSALDKNKISTDQRMSNKNSESSARQNLESDANECDSVASLKGNEMVVIPHRHLDSILPETPSKSEASEDECGRTGKPRSASAELENWYPRPTKGLNAGIKSIQNMSEIRKEISNKEGSLEGEYEYCVKVVRWLECKGHIEKDFRIKFLTWFSLRATLQERRVVSVFVDTLIDDPASLAGQLVDTFSEGIRSKRTPAAATGFCTRLWH